MKDYFVGLKKLPFGFRLLPGLILSLSVTNLLSIQKMSQYIPNYSFYFYLLVFPILFISGIFLLKLKEWARMAVLIISLLASIELAISVPHLIDNAHKYYIKEFMNIEDHLEAMMNSQGHSINSMGETGLLNKDFYVSSQCGFVEAGIVYSFLLYFCSIFYFTRPKVIKLFKN